MPPGHTPRSRAVARPALWRGSCAEPSTTEPNPVAAHVYRTAAIYTADIITSYLRIRGSCPGSSRRACTAQCWRKIGRVCAVHDQGVDHPDVTGAQHTDRDRGEVFPRRLSTMRVRNRPALATTGVNACSASLRKGRARDGHGVRCGSLARASSAAMTNPQRLARRASPPLCA